jgi:hypothetical protein
MVANAACLVGNPIVTATAVNNTPVVVTVTNEVPCAQVGNDLRYGVTLRAFTPADAAVDPTAVMFSAIGTG